MKTKDKDKFREFVKTLKEGQVRHWVEVATAVGVSEATISQWKRLPEAQDVISIAVINTIENMETAGKKDWRMWEAKLKMLGVNPPQKVQATIDDPRKAILDKYLGGEDAGEEVK
jgi:alkylated DNA nucleotide flippase Atl1